MTTQEHQHLNTAIKGNYVSRQKQAIHPLAKEGLKEVPGDFPIGNDSLLLRYGSRYYQIEHKTIAYIYSKESVNVLVTKNGDRFPIHLPLAKLMNGLDQKRFSRMSVDLIANIDAIKGLVRKGGAGLYIDLYPDFGHDFVYDDRYSRKPLDYTSLTQNIRKS